jgi:Tfp pilus assembly protein PilX
MIRRLRHRDEQGSALLIALAFLSLFGVFIAAILSQVSTNLRLTGTTRARADRLMAADGGLEYGVQKARAESACPGPALDVHELTSTLHIDGRDVTVVCQVLAGAEASPASQQWSVITTTGLVTTAGAAPRITGGDVWAGGTLTVGSSAIATTEADVIRAQADCSGYTLAGLTIAVPDTSSCSTAATPDVPHVPPTAPTVVRDSSTPATCMATGATWRIWHPGIYNASAGADIGPNVYMESGVYYFEDTNLIINSSTVIGGAAPSGETSVLGAGCSTIGDTTAGAASRASGNGVTIVLGGTARVQVSSSARLELYSRAPAAADGTPGISIMTVPTTGSGYKAWSAASSLSTTPIGGRVAIHGLVYSPNAPVTITTGFTAPLLGGVVASTLTIIPGALGRQAVQASGRRTLLLTSVAAPAGTDESPAVQSAVVKVANDPTRTASVRSWRAQ